MYIICRIRRGACLMVADEYSLGSVRQIQHAIFPMYSDLMLEYIRLYGVVLEPVPRVI